MTIIKSSDEKSDAYKDEILLRIDRHDIYGKRTVHHTIIEALRSRGESKKSFKQALADMEKEGLILSRNIPVPTLTGVARIHALKKKKLDDLLGKKISDI